MSRTRSTPPSYANPVNWAQYTSTGVLQYVGSDPAFWPAGPLGESSSITDEVVPNYRKRMAQGEVILNPLVMTKQSRSVVESSVIQGPHPFIGETRIYGDYIAVLERMVGDPLSDLEPLIEQMRDVAIIKAYGKVNASDVLIGETAVEFAKTVSMFRHPFKRAQEIMDKTERIRRFRRRRLAESFSTASANAWLETRYGWKPVISDCLNFAKGAEKIVGLLGHRKRRVARSSVSLYRQRDGTHSFGGSLAPAATSGWCNYSATKKVEVSAGVIYEVKPQTTIEQVKSCLGLRQRDMNLIAWEALTLSFVLDWFIQVGDWLQAIYPVPEVDYLGNWVTTVKETFVNYEGFIDRYVPQAPSTTYTSGCGSSQNDATTIIRQVNRPIPSLPVASLNMSLPNYLDAMSLANGSIIQRLRDFRR